MSKYKRIIIGDIHGHWDGFKNIYDYENPDEVIILGDYFDNFHGSDESIMECFKNLQELQQKHRADDTKRGDFIMLIGNHDYHYMFFLERYSGFRPSYSIWAHNTLNEMYDKGLIKYVHVSLVNKVIYSHAGVTNKWLHENAKFDVCDENLHYINDMNQFAFRFTYKGGRDFYGTGMSPYSSPIWVRPETFRLDPYVGDGGVMWTQIFGHTPSNNPQIYKGQFHVDNVQEAIDKNQPNMFMIDCMPNAYLRETVDFTTDVIEKRELIKTKDIKL